MVQSPQFNQSSAGLYPRSYLKLTLHLGARSELQFALDEERSEIKIRPTQRARVISESKEEK
ncbi:hypothetical protein HMPREF2909_06690 [Alloscardovia sp. HMSC034E08]|nr:hypothetical protein HMPREF2909_06690 [Alloscardovia sp. HMSC034E08]